MLNIIICDDNDKDRQNVISITNDFMNKNSLEYKLHIYKDYDKQFLTLITNPMPFKIYLLDIETPSKSGIDIAREIRKKDVESIIVFLTAHEELGNIILKDELLFLGFINKFDDLNNRLEKCLKKALLLFNNKKAIKILDKNIVYTINLNDILYITKESCERKTIIKTDYSEFKINKPLTEIIRLLDDRFIQTHRACYINSDRKILIDKTNRIIKFDNGEKIDLLSEKFKKEVLK